MRRHTIIGERILAAAPALGAGRAPRPRLPRGLRRQRLPRPARRRRDPARRPHHRRLRRLRRDDLQPPVLQPPKTTADALAELRRCAGTQFDPAIVPVFEQIITDRARLPLSTPA